MSINKNAKEKRDYILVPSSIIWDKNLTAAEFKVMVQIIGLIDIGGKGYCWATNHFLAKCVGLSVPYICKIIHSLKAKGYIASSMVYRGSQIAERHIFLKNRG